jgi:bacterioferritin-associated ferredoxin
MVVFHESYAAYQFSDGTGACTDTIVCHCLQVTESTVLEAAERCPFRTLAEISRETGAGTGCTACHRRLRRLVK